MQEYYFNKNEIYYRKNDFQSGKPTLVFVHGVSGSSSAWWPYEKIFEDKYNILTYDIRGHGMSKKYRNYEDYKIENFANDLHQLLSYLGISKFVLISNSFGSLVALEYIKLHRKTVPANILTSPEIYLVDNFSTKIFRPILMIITFILKLFPFNSKPRGHVNYKKYIGSTDWSPGRNIADMKNTGLHAHFYTLRQSMKKNLDYALEKIDVPTLIIHGEKDSMVPFKNIVAVSKKINNSELVVLQNVDHNTVHNAVNKMSESINSFIEKNENNLIY